MATIVTGTGADEARRHLDQMIQDGTVIREIDPDDRVHYGRADRNTLLAPETRVPERRPDVPTPVVIVAAVKSVAPAALLGLLLGPLGMLYATPVGALVMFVISAILHLAMHHGAFLLIAPVAALWAAFAADAYNDRIRAVATRR